MRRMPLSWPSARFNRCTSRRVSCCRWCIRETSRSRLYPYGVLVSTGCRRSRGPSVSSGHGRGLGPSRRALCSKAAVRCESPWMPPTARVAAVAVAAPLAGAAWKRWRSPPRPCAPRSTTPGFPRAKLALLEGRRRCAVARQLAREIIFAIGDNMREGLEPLLTKTLAPSLYQVYLHREDYDRLRTIFPQIEEEARLHLDQQLERLDQEAVPVARKVRGKLPERLRGGDDGAPVSRHVPAEGAWHFRFQEDPNESLEPGEIEVVSELAVGELPDYGGGSATQRIAVSTTRRLGRSATRRQSTGESATSSGAESADAVARPAPEVDMDRTLASARLVPPPLVGVLRWQDDDGDHRFELDKSEIFVGRGAVDVWVDVRVRSKADVSRRHLRIERREPEPGAEAARRYWVEDLSQFGTRLNGEELDRQSPVELPPNAVLELASVLELRFSVEPSEAAR
ncbi:MAG: FHA domain-containing protein [Acidobacteria bacterium]|nr:MAG: FHA domain-containing protein [Acidobacteriota bacterium]